MPIAELNSNTRIDRWHSNSSPCQQGSSHRYIPQKVANREIKRTFENNEVARTSKVPKKRLTLAALREGQNIASSKLPFLWKLHEMLDDVEKTGNQHIVSWLEHGRSFRVHRPKSFVQKIVPFYFRQSKYKSFQRQLHLYEFIRTPRGPEAGAYSHPKFVKGIKALCLSVSPIKIKGKLRMQQRGQLGRNQAKHRSYSAKCYPSKLFRQKPEVVPPEILPCSAEEEPSNWMSKIVLVTGASLAAELEQKSHVEDATPLDGDIVYIFEGMPFRYMNNKPPESEESPVLFDEMEDNIAELRVVSV